MISIPKTNNTYDPSKPILQEIIGDSYEVIENPKAYVQVISNKCAWFEEYKEYLKGPLILIQKTLIKLVSGSKVAYAVFKKHDYTLFSAIQNVAQRNPQFPFEAIINLLILVAQKYTQIFLSQNESFHNCLEEKNIIFFETENNQLSLVFRNIWQDSKLLKHYLENSEKKKVQGLINIAPELISSIQEGFPKGSSEADIFSFGIIISEIIPSIEQYFPEQLSTQISQSFQSIIENTTKQNPEERISWKSLIDDLNNILQLNIESNKNEFEGTTNQNRTTQIQTRLPEFEEIQQNTQQFDILTFQQRQQQQQQQLLQQQQQQEDQQQFDSIPKTREESAFLQIDEERKNLIIENWNIPQGCCSLLTLFEEVQKDLINLTLVKQKLIQELDKKKIGREKDQFILGEKALQYRNFALALEELFYFFSSDSRFRTIDMDLSFLYYFMIQCIINSKNLMEESFQIVEQQQNKNFLVQLEVIKEISESKKKIENLANQYIPSLLSDLKFILQSQRPQFSKFQKKIESAGQDSNQNPSSLTREEFGNLMKELESQVFQISQVNNNDQNPYLIGLSYRTNKLQMCFKNLWNEDKLTTFNFPFYFKNILVINK